MSKTIDLWEQEMEEFEAVILYMENEPICFDSTTWKSKYKGNEFSYQLDLGSAKTDGLNIGRKVTLLVKHNQYSEVSSKSLVFMWQKGRWILFSWSPKEMKFTSLSKKQYVVSEVLQGSLTKIVSDLGKKLCQDFMFLKETPDDFSTSVSISDSDSEFDDVLDLSIPPASHRDLPLSKKGQDGDFKSRSDSRALEIQDCVNELMEIVQCDDQGANRRLESYFKKTLEKYL